MASNVEEPGEVRDVPDQEIVVVREAEFDRTVARALAHALRAKKAEDRSSLSLALAGGGTPRGGYEQLAEQPDIPWEQVEIFFGDERAVPPNDSESNYRMAFESLLSRVTIPEANVHRMVAEQPDREAAAREYEMALPGTLSVLVLGIGEDGHTASLFPGGRPVTEGARRVVPAEGPASPRQRLTITPPVILGARQIFVLARGERKAAAVQRALEGPLDPTTCPAQLARNGTWILDEEAARGLSRQPPKGGHRDG